MDCLGGNRIIIKAGYWRPHNLSDTVVECKNKPENCLESKEYSNFTCVEGNMGALCEACDLHGVTTPSGTKYSISSSYTCGKCDKVFLNGLRVFFMNVWVLFSMLLAVKGTLDLIDNTIMLRLVHAIFKVNRHLF